MDAVEGETVMDQGLRLIDQGPRTTGITAKGVYIDCWLEFEIFFFFCGNRRNRRNAVISE